MGLYLTIFDNDDEVEGVEVGSYADFAFFRDAVVSNVEGGIAGARCPTLILHSDCDGEWSPEDATALEAELQIIAAEFADLPPITLDGWEADVAKTLGLNPANLNTLKGFGQIASGAIEYFGAPVSGSFTTIFGRPVETATGGALRAGAVGDADAMLASLATGPQGPAMMSTRAVPKVAAPTARAAERGVPIVSDLGLSGSQYTLRAPTVAGFEGVEGTLNVTPRARRSGESAAAAYGRQAHAEFGKRRDAKPGWEYEPKLHGADGKLYKSDGMTPRGYILELKPNTPSGRSAGAAQMRNYQEQLGVRGRVICYDPPEN